MALGAALVSAACLPTGGPIPRVYDGMTKNEPAIPAEAYDAYLEGTIREASGDATGARAAYERALAIDPDSPELLTRFASVECTLGDDDVRTAFQRPLAVAPEYGPLWLEMSRCASRRGKKDDAVDSALKAAMLMPLDEETTERLAQALEDRGDRERAGRWRAAWRHRHGPRASDREDPRPPEAASALDSALLAGDLRTARALAVRQRLGSGQLALRAAHLGKAALAVTQAEVALAANPEDADAWVAAVVASDQARDDATLGRLLGRPPVITDASESALAEFALVIERRVGRAAADAFRRALSDTSPTAPDPPTAER